MSEHLQSAITLRRGISSGLTLAERHDGRHLGSTLTSPSREARKRELGSESEVSSGSSEPLWDSGSGLYGEDSTVLLGRH